MGLLILACAFRFLFYFPSDIIFSVRLTVGGVVWSPVEKKKSVPAKSPTLLPTGVAFIPNLIGVYVFILRYQEVPRNTKRLTITVQVQNG